MFVALVREKIVLLRRERNFVIVHGFQITWRRRVYRVDFTAELLFQVYVSMITYIAR